MTHLKILKRARKILKSRTKLTYCGSTYICFAIDEAAGVKDEYKAKQLKWWIETMLGDCLSLKSWLHFNEYPNCTTEQANAHRILWIDKLIGEYENE